MAGFTFVGREPELSAFRLWLERPRGELLLLTGPEGSGKSHLLRQFRHEAEQPGRHVVQHLCLEALLDADLRQYAILSSLAAAHGPGLLRAAEDGGEAAPAARLVPNPRELFGYLLGDDRRPVSAKLAGLLAVASASLGEDSRLVLLLDLGREEGRDAFPIESFVRRLPDKVKLAIATVGAPSGLEEGDGVTVIPSLSPFGEAEVRRILEFHHPRGAPVEALVRPVLAKFQGVPLLTDMAAKVLAGAARPAPADLPATAAGLCELLVNSMNDDERRVVECVARVPAGVDAAALHDLLNVSDADARRLLLLDGVRNAVVMRRSGRGGEARIAHESLADLFLGGDKGADAAAFHKHAAAHFWGLVAKNPHDIEALSAHSYHLRLAGDRAQFMQDFPKTLRLKQSLGLLHLLASEYRLLLLWSRGGDSLVNRPLCMANLARIYQQLGDPSEALRHHRDALEVYQKQNDRSGTAAQLSRIASVLSDLGHYDEAAKSLQQAVSLNEAGGNRAALASDLVSLGMLQERTGHDQEALRSHERALELYRGLKNEPDAAAEIARVAALHHKLGNLREAVARYQEAWRINNRFSATRDEITNLCQLGGLFEEMGDTEKATSCLQQAVELDHALGDRRSEAEHLRALGALHLRLHELDEATRRFRETVNVARSYGDPALEAAGLLTLADAHRAEGRTADARTAVRQAAAIAARLSDAALAQQAEAALAALGDEPAIQAEPEALLPEAAPALDVAPGPSAVEEVSLGEATDGAEEATKAIEAAESPVPAPSEGGEAALRLELDQARGRIRQLEADLQKLTEATEAMRDFLAKFSKGQ